MIFFSYSFYRKTHATFLSVLFGWRRLESCPTLPPISLSIASWPTLMMMSMTTAHRRRVFCQPPHHNLRKVGKSLSLWLPHTLIHMLQRDQWPFVVESASIPPLLASLTQVRSRLVFNCDALTIHIYSKYFLIVAYSPSAPPVWERSRYGKHSWLFCNRIHRQIHKWILNPTTRYAIHRYIRWIADWHHLRMTYLIMALRVRVSSNIQQDLGRDARHLSKSMVRRTFLSRLSNIMWKSQSARQWVTLRRGSYSTMLFHLFNSEMSGTVLAWCVHVIG